MDVHISKDVGNLDISEEGELINQEVGEFEVYGINLDQSNDEHPETKVVAPLPSESLTR